MLNLGLLCLFGLGFCFLGGVAGYVGCNIVNKKKFDLLGSRKADCDALNLLKDIINNNKSVDVDLKIERNEFLFKKADILLKGRVNTTPREPGVVFYMADIINQA